MHADTALLLGTHILGYIFTTKVFILLQRIQLDKIQFGFFCPFLYILLYFSFISSLPYAYFVRFTKYESTDFEMLKITIAGNETVKAKTNLGLRQGCSMSQMLFNLY